MRVLLIGTILSLSLVPATAADFELIVHLASGGDGTYTSQAYYLNHRANNVYNCEARWEEAS